MPRKISDAPGLKWPKGRKHPRWEARRSAVRAGYRPSTVQLDDVNPGDREALGARCRSLWAEMLEWLSVANPPEPAFDGTLGSLVAMYATDPDSPYRELRYSTQQTYDDDMRLLTRFVGARRLDRLTGEDFRRWYRRLKEPRAPGGPERVRRAHGVLTMLRIILGYGRMLGLPHCGRLQDVLHAMRFKTAPGRKTFLTYVQVVAFISKAHELGFPEMALAQALQFEGTLRQVDVIGEWVPQDTQGERSQGVEGRGTSKSRPLPGGRLSPRGSQQRWANGLLWQDIREGVMTKATTKTGAEAAIDFREYPLAMAELAASHPSSGSAR